MRNHLILSCLLIFVAACSPKIDPSDYFPLNEGLTWKYVVSEQHTENTQSYHFFIENLGATDRALPDKYFGMDVYVRRDTNGTQYYILNAEDGKYRIAQQYIIDAKPRYDDVERLILPEREQFDSGNAWFARSRTYALRGAAVDTVPDAEDIFFDMEYEIDSTDVSVKVPAGQFENCIMVVGRASFPLYADPKLGYMDIEITQTEWYAPGVGLVKLLREEPKEAGLFLGGNIVYELLEFNH